MCNKALTLQRISRLSIHDQSHYHPPTGLVLVVSPLLALMRDQLDRLPSGLPGAMLWGGQTRSEAETVIADAARYGSQV